MNEFVWISKPMQSRKDKVNSKDITERFLFSIFDSTIMTQDGNMAQYMAQYEFNSLSLKVKFAISFLSPFIYGRYDSCCIGNIHGVKLSLGVINI